MSWKFCGNTFSDGWDISGWKMWTLLAPPPPPPPPKNTHKTTFLAKKNLSALTCFDTQVLILLDLCHLCQFKSEASNKPVFQLQFLQLRFCRNNCFKVIFIWLVNDDGQAHNICFWPIKFTRPYYKITVTKTIPLEANCMYASKNSPYLLQPQSMNRGGGDGL